MSATLEQVTLSAPDISCGHCVASVQGAVGELNGVTSVTADEKTKLVQIAYDPTQVSLDQIQATLSEEGYPAQRVN